MTAWGCGGAPPPAQHPPPEVGVIEVSAEPVSLTLELPGRVVAFLQADVRPQVNGIIQSRLFEEGQDVTAGDILYQIDAAPYHAAYDRAGAALAVAEAQLPAVRARWERYRNLLAKKVISQQDYDDAAAELRRAEAMGAQRKAEVESARIELAYTRVTAPISGRIGRSNVTPGALVTANQSASLAIIQQFDPAYIDVPQSSKQLLELRRGTGTDRLVSSQESRSVRLVLEDGTPFRREGMLQFRGVQVDPNTGTVNLRITIPNADHILLPGMFVRAIVPERVVRDAILVPQQAVHRNSKGEPLALIVDDGGKVEQRTLALNRAIGNKWLVDSGLAAGDRLIVDGLQNVRPGATVKVLVADIEKRGSTDAVAGLP